MTRRRFAAAVAALALFSTACGSDSEPQAADDDRSTTTAGEGGTTGETSGGDAIARYAAARLDCAEKIGISMMMEDVPLFTGYVDSDRRYFEVNPGSLVTMLLGALAGMAEGLDGSSGDGAGLPDEGLLDELAGSLTQKLYFEGDLVYVGLPDEAGETWYEVPADEFDAGEFDVEPEQLEESCDVAASGMIEIDPEDVWIDPDNPDRLVALPEDAVEDEEGTDIPAGKSTDLTDDEIRELRDSDARTIIELDGDRVVRAETLDGLTVVMEFTYGAFDAQRPQNATRISGEELAKILEERESALDARFGSLFGFGEFDESMIEGVG